MNNSHCARCNQILCPREVLCNQALGYLTHYRCLECLAREKAHSVRALYDNLRSYIQDRPCLAEVWEKITVCPPLDRQCTYCE